MAGLGCVQRARCFELFIGKVKGALIGTRRCECARGGACNNQVESAIKIASACCDTTDLDFPTHGQPSIEIMARG